MDTLQIFENIEMNINFTCIHYKGKPYFIPSEVGEALGYSNLSHSIRNTIGLVENIDYKVFNGLELNDLKALSESSSTAFVSKNQNSFTLLTESGLYAVILKSKKPYAIKIRIWVTSDVLPAIRKTGSYGLQEKVETLDKMFTGLDCRIMKLESFLINFIQAIDAKKDNILPALPLTTVLDNLEKDKPVILDVDKPVILDNPKPASIGLVTMLGKYKIFIHNRTKRLRTHIRKYQVYLARYKRKMIYLGKEYNEAAAIEKIKAYEKKHKIEPSLLEI